MRPRLLLTLALGAMLASMGCGSEPRCQGPPIHCADYHDGVHCPQWGCQWWGFGCEGPSSVDCHVVGTDEETCRAELGCSWSSLEGSCSGSSSCQRQTTPETCRTLKGCTPHAPACMSPPQPPDCEHIAEHVACAELGCQWK